MPPGSGGSSTFSLRSWAYIDSMQVLINENLGPTSAGTDTVPKPPLAYNPTGSPRPFPLNGTAWQPPAKYRRGAETIRWTLDVDNDGQVNANDVANANSIMKNPTPNASEDRRMRRARWVDRVVRPTCSTRRGSSNVAKPPNHAWSASFPRSAPARITASRPTRSAVVSTASGSRRCKTWSSMRA